MTEPRGQRPDMDLVLPGRWGTIDLTDAETSRRAVRTVVAQAIGRRDDMAAQRARLRAQTEALAAQAREGGATDLYIALELVPGLAVPLSLTVFWPAQAVLGSSPSAPETVIDRVHELLATRDDDHDDSDDLIEDLGETATLRRCRLVHNDADADTDAPAYDTLIVDYWLAVPGTQHVVLLTFSTPFLQGAEQVLALFRAMVNVIRWHDPADAPAAADATRPRPA